MLLHVSVEADDPHRLALAVAELWGGEAFPYPVAVDDAWMAIAADGQGTMIEVLPRGTELRAAVGDGEAIGVIGPPRRYSGTHVAIQTILHEPAVMALGAREGWAMRRGTRAGGAFFVIEAWVEGCLMLELITPAMHPAYRQAVTIENCRRMLAPVR